VVIAVGAGAIKGYVFYFRVFFEQRFEAVNNMGSDPKTFHSTKCSGV